jgi:hypothetical protein
MKILQKGKIEGADVRMERRDNETIRDEHNCEGKVN